MTGYNQPVPHRPAGKLGCKPGYVPVGLRELTFYAAGPLPAPPTAVACPVPPANADGTPWGMDGNDTHGDCGVAGAHHGNLAVDVLTGQDPGTLTADQIVQYYLTYTGGQDGGVVLADFLAYVRKTGWFGKALIGYAPASITDYQTLQFIVSAYGYAYTGLQVTDLMMQAFQAHQPWTADAFTSGQVVGGHCVPLVGYDSQNLYCVTWGGIQAIQYSAWHRIALEAWAVIWGEMPENGIDGHGVNLAALNADLPLLTA